jgi:serine/threonine protein phosphatase PrpC
VIGASVQGTSHVSGGVPCQDAHGVRQLPTGEWLIAVADGAGSASRSAEGSALAVEHALAALAVTIQATHPADEAAWRVVMAIGFGVARDAIVKHAEQANNTGTAGEGVTLLTLRDFATTLTCAVLAPGMLCVGQLGDGFAVAMDAGGRLFTAARPQRGEYANEAYFITMEQAADLVEMQVIGADIAALAVSTDGLLRLALKLPSYEPHAPFFKPLFDFALGAASDETAPATAQLTDFLNSPRVCARTDDDKTLVLAARDSDLPQ